MKHIKLIQITENKKRFLPLLLMADEQENMIDRYLDRGTLYAILDDAYKSSDTNQPNKSAKDHTELSQRRMRFNGRGKPHIGNQKPCHRTNGTQTRIRKSSNRTNYENLW